MNQKGENLQIRLKNKNGYLLNPPKMEEKIDLGSEKETNRLNEPFIAPDDIDLQNGNNKSSPKNSRHHHSINNLIPLLINPTGDHHHQILLPLLQNPPTRFPILITEIQTWPIAQPIRLFPKPTLFFFSLLIPTAFLAHWHNIEQ